MLLAPVVWVLTVVIAYFFAAKTWWFPPPISAHGIAYDAQFMRTLIVVGIIFFLAQFALGYVIVKFRNDGRRAGYSHGNNKLETIWTSATALLFLGLVLMGTKIWAGVHFDEAPADAIPIEVTGQAVRLEFPLSRPGRQVRPHRSQTGQRFQRQSVRPRREGPGRQGRHRQRVAQGSRRQAHQADHALPGRDPQLLRARTAHEAGYRARHGDPAAFPGRHRSASTKSPAPSCAAWATSRCAPPCR